MPDPVCIDRLKAARVIAVIRAPAPELALAAVDALVQGGLRAVEVTYSTPGAGRVIAEVARQHAPEVAVCAGTVRHASDVGDALSAGAEFIVSPGIDPAVIKAAKHADALVIPGALTRSEILRAQALGAAAIKLFPASLGGPGLLRALREPFPDISFVPTGGVSLDNLAEWFAAGATAVAAGTSLCSRDDITAGRFEAIRDRAARFMDACER
jgi:2-dehydro-3-deoxyphosphogluconate aldolase/(4S)-4-hydroxy-2-oxoglutarate aldolase